jgi:hypothetical protein
MAIVNAVDDVALAIDALPRRGYESVDITVLVAGDGLTAHERLRGARALVLLNTAEPDSQVKLDELVCHLRRVRPQVVLTVAPEQSNALLGCLATTAVLLAADVRFGQTCTTRAAHTISKLYHVQPGTSTPSLIINTAQPGRAGDESDLLAGLGQTRLVDTRPSRSV